ncbi:MAG: hypothetical protein ACC642_01195, partial [Pseudomonadales bacterium]
MDNEQSKDAQLRTPKRKSRRSAGNALWNHALLAIGVSVIGMLTMAGLLWWQLVESSNSAYLHQQMALTSNAYAGYFNGQIQQIRTRVNALANAKETVAAVISNDPDEMERLSVALTAQSGYARRIQIFPRGKAQKDDNGIVPISFAALNLILRAEKEPFVGPEISLAQENLVFVAHPIEHDGLVRGVLFVAFDRKGLFFDPLTHMDGNLGQVRISQIIAGSAPTEVFSFGVPGSGADVIRTPLIAPQWTLEFVPNYQALSPISRLTDLLTALAVMMGFFLAGISFAFSSLSRKLQKDADTLSSYISQLLRGRGPSLDRYQLVLFQQIASNAAQFGGGRKAAAPEQKAGTGSGDPADLLAEDEGEDEGEGEG